MLTGAVCCHKLKEKKMVEIESTQIEAVYQKFCQIMGHKEGGWNSIFEFTVMVGFPLLDVRTEQSVYPDYIASNINAFSGPHSDTLLKAYRARRKTFRGAVRACPLKIAHFFGYLFCGTIGTYRAWRRVW